MKEVLAGVAAVCAFILVHFLNKRIIGDRSAWKGQRIQPRGTYTGSFPVAATNESEAERRDPAKWLWVLADLLVFVLLAIYLLARLR